MGTLACNNMHDGWSYTKITNNMKVMGFTGVMGVALGLAGEVGPFTLSLFRRLFLGFPEIPRFSQERVEAPILEIVYALVVFESCVEPLRRLSNFFS